MNTYPIGIFDSGVGGLTVYRALKRALPHENFLYLGDTARLPYGTKTSDTITLYSLQAAKTLIEAGVKFLVIACNTATSSALLLLQKTYPDLPIIGVIEPGADAALTVSSGHPFAVIATPATVRSQAYEKAILARDPHARIRVKATPLLVAIAEEGLIQGEITEKILHHYLDEWLNLAEPDRPHTLILGCTHFPVLMGALRRVVGQKMQIIDSAETVAAQVSSYFKQHPALANSKGQGNSEFWVTDGIERFENVAHIFLDEPILSHQIKWMDLI